MTHLIGACPPHCLRGELACYHHPDTRCYRPRDVYPDLTSVGGRSTLIEIIGALLTIVLIVAVLMLVVSGIVWAVSSSGGNPQTSAKGKVGVFVALGAAVLAGAGVT